MVSIIIKSVSLTVFFGGLMQSQSGGQSRTSVNHTLLSYAKTFATLRLATAHPVSEIFPMHSVVKVKNLFLHVCINRCTLPWFGISEKFQLRFRPGNVFFPNSVFGGVPLFSSVGVREIWTTVGARHKWYSSSHFHYKPLVYKCAEWPNCNDEGKIGNAIFKNHFCIREIRTRVQLKTRVADSHWC